MFGTNAGSPETAKSASEFQRSITHATGRPDLSAQRSPREGRTTPRPTNTTSMHDALLVDEITRRIAEHLFDPKDKWSSLAFSLCCQSLNEPVLDVLWKWQTDLLTLFKVLPPDLWEVSSTVGLVSTDQWLAAD